MEHSVYRSAHNSTQKDDIPELVRVADGVCDCVLEGVLLRVEVGVPLGVCKPEVDIVWLRVVDWEPLVVSEEVCEGLGYIDCDKVID